MSGSKIWFWAFFTNYCREKDTKLVIWAKKLTIFYKNLPELSRLKRTVEISLFSIRAESWIKDVCQIWEKSAEFTRIVTIWNNCMARKACTRLFSRSFDSYEQFNDRLKIHYHQQIPHKMFCSHNRILRSESIYITLRPTHPCKPNPLQKKFLSMI